jgi:hypothetical protein
MYPLLDTDSRYSAKSPDQYDINNQIDSYLFSLKNLKKETVASSFWSSFISKELGLLFRGGVNNTNSLDVTKEYISITNLKNGEKLGQNLIFDIYKIVISKENLSLIMKM